jgi:diaminopimelate epimerase
MQIHFQKYHGTGNDFIMLDNRKGAYSNLTQKEIALLCHRNYGIGADGLIMLENDRQYDFYMKYFNADGNEGSMCGNGGRCTVHFAKALGIIREHTTFKAIDGIHHADIEENTVTLQMQDVSDIELYDDYTFLNTGSPHHVEMVSNLDQYPVYKIGKEKRWGKPYYKKGSNINFVEQVKANTFKVRTYERGVENETLSCGTGVTATAIAMHKTGKTTDNHVFIKMPGGDLEVRFEENNDTFSQVYLIGEATFVFKGTIEI